MYRRRLTPPPGCYLLSKLIYSTRGVLKHKYAQNGGVGECQTTFHGLDHTTVDTFTHDFNRTFAWRRRGDGAFKRDYTQKSHQSRRGTALKYSSTTLSAHDHLTCTKKRSQCGHVGKEGKGAECEHPTLWDMHGRKTA